MNFANFLGRGIFQNICELLPYTVSEQGYSTPVFGCILLDILCLFLQGQLVSKRNGKSLLCIYLSLKAEANHSLP